jgi:hypothetical protein
MARLTVKQRQFVERHGLDPDLHALDATGMTRAQFREELSRERRLIVYGVSPCPRGHTLRTAGGCPQCDTSYIAYAQRSRLPGYVYIAKSGGLTKVGFSQDAPNRVYIANVEGYAGEQNWRIRALVYSPNAGQIELAAHRALSRYGAAQAWKRNGATIYSKEVFRCSFTVARGALLSVLTAEEASDLEELR